MSCALPCEVPCSLRQTGVSKPLSPVRFRHRLSAAERQRVNRQRDHAPAGEGDEKAELALSRYEQRLAKSLAHVVECILDPDPYLVLGGGMSNVVATAVTQTVPVQRSSGVSAASVNDPLVMSAA